MTMTPTPMMQCGHAANAVRVHRDGTKTPSCAICAPSVAANTVDTTPASLEGRQARCHCGQLEPSDSSGRLAFFEYRGPGAPNRVCGVGKCHFVESVHQPINPHTGREGVTDHAFRARVYDYDAFYCGCDGWD